MQQSSLPVPISLVFAPHQLRQSFKRGSREITTTHMRSRTFTSSVIALLLFAVSIVEAKHSHGHLDTLYKRHLARREQHKSIPEAGESGIALRSSKEDGGNHDQCRFPDDAGLVAVTPHEQNAGWAMSPDQPCLPDSYCPYACPPGQVMMQWDPTATSYSYPKSMVSAGL